jgi:hypothetical protein
MGESSLQVETDPGKGTPFATAYAINSASDHVDKNSWTVAVHPLRHELRWPREMYRTTFLKLGGGKRIDQYRSLLGLNECYKL